MMAGYRRDRNRMSDIQLLVEAPSAIPTGSATVIHTGSITAAADFQFGPEELHGNPNQKSVSCRVLEPDRQAGRIEPPVRQHGAIAREAGLGRDRLILSLSGRTFVGRLNQAEILGPLANGRSTTIAPNSMRKTDRRKIQRHRGRDCRE